MVHTISDGYTCRLISDACNLLCLAALRVNNFRLAPCLAILPVTG